MKVKRSFVNWLSAFWWFRGILAALTLTSTLPNLVDLSRNQILRAVHLVIFRWSEVASAIGKILGKVPYFPDLNPEQVNAALFSLSVCVPAAFGFIFRQDTIESGADQGRKIIRFFRRHPRTWLLFIVLRFSNSFISLFIVFAIPYLLFFVPYREIIEGGADSIVGLVVTGIYVIPVLAFIYIVGVTAVPEFLRAMMFTVSCIITLEVLYLINTPLLGDWIDSQYCLYVQYSNDCV